MTTETESDVLLLGHEVIDADHQKADDLLQQLNHARGDEFVRLFIELDEHLQAHFARENTLMTIFSYPAMDEHRSEHTRILSELVRFRERVSQGRTRFAKAYVNDQLPDWLALHISTMDAALVRYVEEKHAQ